MPSTVQITAPARPSVVRISAETRSPAVRVFSPSRASVVRQEAPAQPTLIRRETPGIPGPQGGQGEQGPQGIPGDYGYIRFGEVAGTSPAPLAPFTDAPFIVQPPRVVRTELKPPFADFVFLDAGGLLRARKAGDAMLLSVRFSVVPQVYGGWIRLSIVIPGNVAGLAGPVASRTVGLTDAAGSTHRIDEDLDVFPAEGFINNGASIVLRASVPVLLSDEVLFVRPTVAAP